MIIKDSNFHKLSETDKFVLGYVFEHAYLINKKTNKEIDLGDLYGDPSCGLISQNNDWCFVGGETLSIWKADGNISRIEDDELHWICKVRQTALYEAELLIDPWSDKGSIWKLNINTFDRHKLKDFKINDGYSEEVYW
jgi:hypothetical protein